MSDAGNVPQPDNILTTFVYDARRELVAVEAPTPPGSTWKHDEARRVFRITGPDGKTTEFHDRALRFLVVAPDPQAGKLAPALSRGVPTVLHLCREAGL